jgi:Ca2+-binding RTX toxin-like protein
MLIEYSTLSNNSAEDDGGGLTIDEPDGETRVVNSTISGNVAGGTGGGVNSHNAHDAPVAIENSTIAENQAYGYDDPGTGGGVFQTGYDDDGYGEGEGDDVTLSSTIVADNIPNDLDDPGDVNTFVADYSLIENPDDVSIILIGLNNVTGQDPELRPLGDNGGPTATHALDEDSPAVDAGINDEELEFDQRGAPPEGSLRTVDNPDVPNPGNSDGTNMGAVEMEQGGGGGGEDGDGDGGGEPPPREGPVGDATCGDGVDNDEDGAVDGADTDCQTPEGPPPPQPPQQPEPRVPRACDIADPNVIAGTNGDDTLTGTSSPDAILGLLGADTLFGGGAGDCLFGGGGNDVLRGHGGGDLASGGSGEDKVRGNGGGDDLKGNAADDNVRGGRGGDTVKGNRGDDQLRGNRGGDRLGGGRGDDVLRGGRGDDVINCGRGTDEAFTDPGDTVADNCEVVH